MSDRTLRRLALAGALVVVVGLVHGLDTGMILTLALAVWRPTLISARVCGTW